jgi:DNA-binding protein YbaB
VVKAVAKGDMTVVSLNVDPKAVDPQDVEMLQDLVISAVNGALKLARDSASEEMGKITGGLNIPGM